MRIPDSSRTLRHFRNVPKQTRSSLAPTSSRFSRHRLHRRRDSVFADGNPISFQRAARSSGCRRDKNFRIWLQFAAVTRDECNHLGVRRYRNDLGAAIEIDGHIISFDTVDLIALNLVGLLGHRSVGHAALWSRRSIGHATLWSKIPRAVSFAGSTHRLGENMDFDSLQFAVRSWSCRSANKASRLDIG